MKSFFTKTYFWTADINELSKDPNYFADVLEANPWPIFRDPYIIQQIIRKKNVLSNPKFNSIFNHKFRFYHLEKLLSVSYCPTLREVRLLPSLKPYLHKDVYEYALVVYEKQIGLFPHPAQKAFLHQLIQHHKGNETKLIEIIKRHKGKMDKKMAMSLINKVSYGIKNIQISKIIDGSKKLRTIKYVEEDLKNDNKRIELLKNLATTPTSIKNLNFDPTFSYDDLKKLAPVMRFNLLKFVFKHKVNHADDRYATYMSYNTFFWKIQNLEKRGQQNRITLPTMTQEQLKDLLFAVGIKKNAQVAEFIERYFNYFKILKELEQKQEKALHELIF